MCGYKGVIVVNVQLLCMAKSPSEFDGVGRTHSHNVPPAMRVVHLEHQGGGEGRLTFHACGGGWS